MILVTGASGALGGKILARLAATGADVTAGTREPSRWTGPVPVRRIDFDDPDSLVDGFAEVDVLLFVSAGYAEDDVVLARHGAVATAAEKAGVRHVIYTSLAGSGEGLTIALAHRWTERRLAEAPFATTVLRNGLYAELLGAMAAPGLPSGTFAAAWGAGRVAAVARDDLVDAAVRVATEAAADTAAGEPGRRHGGRTYELEGVEDVDGAELAAGLSAGLGVPLAYVPVPLAAVREGAAALGLEPYQVGHTVSTHSNIAAGTLGVREGHLRELLDGEPRPVVDAAVAAVRALIGG